ncbi:hypothetical protein BH23ACT10_BH23ACT10_16860 [soil metagenome]
MRTSPRGSGTASRLLLAALLAASGAAHIAIPGAFERLIPRWLPGEPALWNQVATAAELGSAALLATGRTARAGGLLAFATFACVWVANVQAALDGGYRELPGWLSTGTAAWLRVPLQLPLLWWAATIARRTPDDPRGTRASSSDSDRHTSRASSSDSDRHTLWP